MRLNNIDKETLNTAVFYLERAIDVVGDFTESEAIDAEGIMERLDSIRLEIKNTSD